MPSRLFEQTIQRLDASRDPQFGASTAGFFKEPVKARGVPSPILLALSAEIYREIKLWPVKQRDKFITELWKDQHIETGTLACYTYRRFAKTFGEREFSLFEHWLEKYVKNWAHCDGLCVYLLAPTIARHSRLACAALSWARSKNQWMRRGAAVALVKEARSGRRLDLVCDVAEILANDREDLVQKGAGWLLKEAYPKRPQEVVDFIKARGKGWPRLVLRYAAEKMDAQDKQAVLSWDN